MKVPALAQLQRTKTTPIDVIRTPYSIDVGTLTTLPAGKMVPLVALPILREERLHNSDFRISFEMMETVETLMNAVNVSVKAYLVPNVAHKRFSGFDEFNRSYEGVPNQEGGPVTPYFVTEPAPAYGANPILKYLGLHYAPGDLINTAYVEAYNMIWNFRAKNRSKSLTLRGEYDTTLAPAFWQHDAFRHIVPDFDQAVVDGQVALNVVNSKMPVRGLYGSNVAGTAWTQAAADGGWKDATGQKPTVGKSYAGLWDPAAGNMVVADRATAAPYLLDVYAELQQNGITVSLSNIELAKKTQAFAEMRKQYAGHSDDYIIDILMNGLTMPELAWRQPILLAEKNTIFGMAKRYATDAGNLTDSVVNGATFVDMTLRCPQVPCGGVLMIVAEITPEQFFERQRDPYLYTTTPDQLPQYLRDTLDPEKVDVVKNGEIDTSHSTPNGVFGYQPLNGRWQNSIRRVGGELHRPQVNTTFDEARQIIWAVETLNPTLGPDFYLCNGMHTKPFVVTNKDIGQALIRGNVNKEGLTVFGPALIESNGDYADVLADAPQGRIVKP